MEDGLASIVSALSPKQLVAIDRIGSALFADRPMRVGFKGLVSIKPSTTNDDKGEENGQRQGQGSRRPAAEPRPGRQRSPRPRHSDSSDVLRWAVEDQRQLRFLREAYPSAKTRSDNRGTWLVVRTFPLGVGGPQAILLIMVPRTRISRVESWGYWWAGEEPMWIGPRHTNFPNGSICAFPIESNPLDCDWPLTRYVDLLSEWCARHLYYAVHDKWPGPQEGRWTWYRLLETRSGECCPRCGSLEPYENCCKSRDEKEMAQRPVVPDPLQFPARLPPSPVEEFAKRAGRNPPRIMTVLRSQDELAR